MKSPSPVRSMTGFCSLEAEGPLGRLRVELKTLNHRFLDVKIRLPREFVSLEPQARALAQARLTRGSLDLRVDFEPLTPRDETPPEANYTLATYYFESLKKIQLILGLNDPIRTIDIALLPDVLQRKSSSETPAREAQELWPHLESTLHQAIDRLQEMRTHEGANLWRVLHEAVDENAASVGRLRARREDLQSLEKGALISRVQRAFDAYPIADKTAKELLESRVAQELALILERGDVEEELTRLLGHIGHFQETLAAGGAVGKKLEFLLQEMHREINTLGSKSQDLGISNEVVAMKVRLEQIREQVMNIE